MESKLRAVLLLTLLFCQAFGDEIFGCGGFIRTEVEINFSLIEVKLYTKQGSLKYQTDCAPNNGYYMLPVYNKGEYVIKVGAPAGWTFEPMSYSIAIDGKTDKCTLSEDINFLFTGFGVVGKVMSKGQDSGPAGILLTLKSPTSGDMLMKTMSASGGGYTFEKVLPGEYIVEASHNVWMFESATGRVSLTKETGRVTDTIVVSGFDVRGEILSDGEPVSGVNFFLYASKKVELRACMKSPASSHDLAVEGAELLCSVASDGKGRFAFPAVPTGDYILIPFYKGEKIKYDVVPGRIDISVLHDSVVVQEPFQVAGFLVSGKVKASPKGDGIPDAQVFINGSPASRTGRDGVFHLEAMRAGMYELKAEALRMQFDTLKVKVTPNTPHLPDLVATKFEVCGKIVVDELHQSPSASRLIVFYDKKGNEYAEVQSLEDGTFCTFLAPGAYKCSARISEEEKDAGFRLLPYENNVDVTDVPVDGIMFSQFHAKISGTISCLETCGTIQLMLQSSMKMEENRILDVSSTSETVTFQFENIMAGNYELLIQNDKWCWLNKSLPITLIDKDVHGLAFTHSGYMVVCSLSHDASLLFNLVSMQSEKEINQPLHFDLNRGLNRFCLKEAGEYHISVDSCHQFEKQSYDYNTAVGGVLSLTATMHKVEISLTTVAKHNDDVMAIIRGQDDEVMRIGPLVLKDALNKQKEYEYIIEYWTKSGERISVSLESSILLFEPSSLQLAAKPDLCPSGRALFTGRKGIFVEGGVVPPLAEVDVAVTLNTGKILHAITDDKGKYSIGPIDAKLKYEAEVSKSGFAFVPMADREGFFRVSKLAEIIVKVKDENTGAILSGVLLSLSGGESFRKNNVTQDVESLVFSDLGPGKYFLKPMMKEYEFEPTSKFIEVAEGATVEVEVVARRIAFSCYAHVTSLNGEPESGVHLEALSDGNGGEVCQNHQEESKTGLDGSIRIRGLNPGCSYVLRLKEDRDLNTIIERTSPKQIKLKIEDRDIRDVRLVAFRRINVMDISGRVDAPQEYLSSLKVYLLQEANLDATQQSSSLGPSPFFYFSSISIDNQTYLLRLTSTLSRIHFNFSLPELQFRADSPFKHFTLQFSPQPKVGDQELAPSSFLVLPVTLIILYICYNRKQVFPSLLHYTCGLLSLLPSRTTARSSPPLPQATADPFSPDLLNEFPSKKKQKAKKI